MTRKVGKACSAIYGHKCNHRRYSGISPDHPAHQPPRSPLTAADAPRYIPESAPAEPPISPRAAPARPAQRGACGARAPPHRGRFGARGGRGRCVSAAPSGEVWGVWRVRAVRQRRPERSGAGRVRSERVRANALGLCFAGLAVFPRGSRVALGGLSSAQRSQRSQRSLLGCSYLRALARSQCSQCSQCAEEESAPPRKSRLIPRNIAHRPRRNTAPSAAPSLARQICP